MLQTIAVDEFTSLEAWRTTFAEFVATLLFVFIGAGSVVVTGAMTDGELTAPRLLVIALAHGFAIALLAYATANISGGHINPAVTFAAWVTNNISTARALMFVLAQLVGAVAGALLLLAAIPDAADTSLGAHALGGDVSISMGLVPEEFAGLPRVVYRVRRDTLTSAFPPMMGSGRGVAFPCPLEVSAITTNHRSRGQRIVFCWSRPRLYFAR